MPSDAQTVLRPGQPIFLVGYRCTGKSTVGQKLAAALDRPFVDTDREIEGQAGTTIAEMVDRKGWDYFRDRERQCLASLIREPALEPAPVVATGGGMILAQENRNRLKTTGLCIWLTADEGTIIRRLKGDAHSPTLRPHLTDGSLEAETRNLLASRTALYREVADFSLDTAAHDPDACVQLILRRLDS